MTINRQRRAHGLAALAFSRAWRGIQLSVRVWNTVWLSRRTISVAAQPPHIVYRHGRASRSQAHPSAECLHLIERLPAFPYLAQSEPYSRAVKSAHDLIASASAAARLPFPELLPEWK
jgi:hypothetical protein